MNKKLKAESLEMNQAYNQVQQWFFAYPTREMGLNDLSGEMRISKTTAKEIVLALEEDGFLRREVLGRLWRISCNPHHPYNYMRKVSYNLMLIYESSILKAIHEMIPNPKSVILFGSYRKGDDTEKSDIDIAVEVVGNEGVKLVKLGVIPQLGYRENVTVNLYVFSRNKIDLNLFANIANGIVLEGFLEVRP
ncbi:MAG: nucleotidyltransferase domain-containing protein [Candidatus Aenigmarchaeota archaeon]|jgi:predicted nucleotidyltransferase|nr:nucleotidyltransferase domain-containing protein [Candidatus Aenigmarchaeota archaeon]